MTDIIDKVAEALATDHYSERFGKQKDDPHVLLNAKSQAHIFRRQATAALEALAEGLVWGMWDMLCYQGYIVDGVKCSDSDKKWFTDANALESYQTREEAQTAAMNHARRVLFGLGPIGGENA